MIINQTNFTEESLRDLFCDAVTKVFGDATTFLDFLEDEEYSDKYDCCLNESGENYIINRETGEYINWYKLTHIGRCINISTSSTCNIQEWIEKWFEEFLTDFKESEKWGTSEEENYLKIINPGEDVDTCYGLELIELEPKYVNALLEGKQLYTNINCGEYAVIVKTRSQDNYEIRVVESEG